MNHNAKGKGLIFGEKAKKVTLTLYSWEVDKVKMFIKTFRNLKRIELKQKAQILAACLIMSGAEGAINFIFSLFGA